MQRAVLIEPPGELLEVDGHRLHLVRRGTGAPAVIFEAGAGQLAYSWRHVMDGVSAFATAVAWDRPGYGWSDPANTPLRLESVNRALLGLLEAATIPPPYVLVGHSLGAYYVRDFAARHPELVCGAVLVDPSHERMFDSVPRALRMVAVVALQLQARAPGLVAPISRRSMRTAAAKAFPDLSAGGVDELVAMHLRPETLRSQFAEFRQVSREAAALGVQPGSMGDIPLVVLGAGKLPGGPAFRRHREEVQLPELVSLSRAGSLRVAAESGHGIPLEDPAAIVEAVRDVIAKANW